MSLIKQASKQILKPGGAERQEAGEDGGSCLVTREIAVALALASSDCVFPST